LNIIFFFFMYVMIMMMMFNNNISKLLTFRIHPSKTNISLFVGSERKERRKERKEEMQI